MKNTVAKVLLAAAMVAAIVGLVCIVVSMMIPSSSWVLIAGQSCVTIGLIITIAEAVKEKKEKKEKKEAVAE